jgi:hypothetical protein
MDTAAFDHNFLQPLCSAWASKVKAAREGRKDWEDAARECLMFYGHSAAAMYNEKYQEKFWGKVKIPRFRVTINKAFEFVAVYSPNLMWDYPQRDVKPRKSSLQIGPEFFADDPQMAQMMPFIQQFEQKDVMKRQAVATMIQEWLNYTSRETPGGGMAKQSKRAILDALLFGRGVLAARPYKMPGSDKVLTGTFHESPFNILLDPDHNKVEDCKWVAIIHEESYTDVEERFSLKPGTLKNACSLESATMRAELTGDAWAPIKRASTRETNDIITWYEIYSTAGCGCPDSMDSNIREHMEEVIGKNAYIAICHNVPYPLNCHPDVMRNGTDDQVREAFSWPIPFWKDRRLPVEFLDFDDNPDSCWPLPPLTPGMGELKLLNFLVTWLTNRVWTSSRDFWAVAGPHVDHYRQYLMNGDDQCIIPTPFGVDDIRKAVQLLQQPETRQDMEDLIAFVSSMFDKRVFLTPFMYGLNQDGTQNRTAEETLAKSRAVSARPEFMQKQVKDFMARVSQAEAIVTQLFVTGKDSSPVVGILGGMLWDKYITPQDDESILRQYDFTVDAASMLRPNRERDIANYQQVTSLFLPIVQSYAQATGNYDALNGFMDKWAEMHDEDLSNLRIPPKEVTPEQQQMSQLQMAQLQADVAKTQAEAQAKQADAQATLAEAQNAPMMAQMEQMMAQQKLQSDQQKAYMDQMAQMFKLDIEKRKADLGLQTQTAKAQADMIQSNQKHNQEMRQDQAKAVQEIQQQQAMGAVKLDVEQAMAEQKIETQREMAKEQIKAQKAKASQKPKKPEA